MLKANTRCAKPTNLKEEVSRQIRVIETEELNVLRRSLAVSEMLEEVFDRLKQFIAGYEFTDEEEEIHFFMDIKPRRRRSVR